MKRLISMFAFMLLLASAAFAQDAHVWAYDGVFPDTTGLGKNGGIRRGPHGVAVDPDGKIWVVQYYPRTQSSKDTILVNGVAKSANAVYVFNPDGSEVDFSPILFFKKGETIIDTMGYEGTAYNSGRGIAMGPDGNMVVAFYDYMYKLDYQTGEGLEEPITLGFVDGGSVRGASCPAIGGGVIFVRSVFGGSTNLPLKMYDYSNMTFLGNAADQTVGFNRAITVSEDASALYVPAYDLKLILKYSKPDEFSGYEPSYYLLGPATETLGWDKTTGLLWIGGGSYNDLPVDTLLVDSVATPADHHFLPNYWYGINAETKEIKDSIAWKWDGASTTDAAQRPRATAFSADGNYAYLGTFSSGILKRYKKTTVGVDEEPNAPVVNGYSLSQNYPNPFNPATVIKFHVAKEGLVSLKVYNTLGQEVAELVNEFMTAGDQTVNFNASHLASGTYIYRLNVNGVSLTNKMMLVK